MTNLTINPVTRANNSIDNSNYNDNDNNDNNDNNNNACLYPSQKLLR
jgi:hypothetical protein